MLFKSDELKGIDAGEITVAFRRWMRPTVQTGGTLRIPGGVLAIEAVDEIELAEITERDARLAGRESRASLLAELEKHADRTLYRIRFRRAGGDERVALRNDTQLSEGELARIVAALARMDRNIVWTRKVLNAIATAPGKRAADLAKRLGYETSPPRTACRAGARSAESPHGYHRHRTGRDRRGV